jgi:hypothetical protein
MASGFVWKLLFPQGYDWIIRHAFLFTDALPTIIFVRIVGLIEVLLSEVF